MSNIISTIISTETSNDETIITTNLCGIEIGHWAARNGNNLANILSTIAQDLEDREIEGFVSELYRGLWPEDFLFLGEVYSSLSCRNIEDYRGSELAKKILIAVVKFEDPETSEIKLTGEFVNSFSDFCAEVDLVFLEQLIAATRALKDRSNADLDGWAKAEALDYEKAKKEFLEAVAQKRQKQNSNEALQEKSGDA